MTLTLTDVNPHHNNCSIGNLEASIDPFNYMAWDGENCLGLGGVWANSECSGEDELVGPFQIDVPLLETYADAAVASLARSLPGIIATALSLAGAAKCGRFS